MDEDFNMELHAESIKIVFSVMALVKKLTQHQRGK
jgi:hypothetical protein